MLSEKPCSHQELPVLCHCSHHPPTVPSSQHPSVTVIWPGHKAGENETEQWEGPLPGAGGCSFAAGCCHCSGKVLAQRSAKLASGSSGGRAFHCNSANGGFTVLNVTLSGRFSCAPNGWGGGRRTKVVCWCKQRGGEARRQVCFLS